jgi:GT2 family glycosyltransferase
MKIAVVMTYFERPFQLHETLLSIAKTEHKDFEVIIVTDENQLKFEVPNLTYKPIILSCKKDTKDWVGSMMAFNIGFKFAISGGADIILMQHAECYHVGDVISIASTVTNRNYISFGCYSIDEGTTFSEHDIFEVIKKNNDRAKVDGQNAWYNHPTKRPVGYNFCSAITVDNLKRLNGFDERFKDGIAYDDDDFINRVKLLRLRVDITDNPFVVHQWHFSGHGLIPDKRERMEKNKELFISLKKNGNIRAKHLITADL